MYLTFMSDKHRSTTTMKTTTTLIHAMSTAAIENFIESGYWAKAADAALGEAWAQGAWPRREALLKEAMVLAHTRWDSYLDNMG